MRHSGLWGGASAICVILIAIAAGPAAADGWDPPGSPGYGVPYTRASNIGSIANTRHNLTQSFIPGGWGNWMDYARNNYGEVCVYCHTPHGANSTINAPLWNRTNLSNTYTLYNVPLTSGQTPTQPGMNSLTCLSCHDGTVAIDSIINMPGSGGYSASQQTSQNNAFLDTWDNSWTGSGVEPVDHGVIWNAASGYMTGSYNCNRCHENGNVWDIPAFEIFYIGTDLTNDHPVGVQLPNTATFDFNPPTATKGNLKFYDTNANGRADTTEIRFYNTGGGYEVECASCHDPHGAPSAGQGSLLIPSFLRVSNSGSALCLTCHVK